MKKQRRLTAVVKICVTQAEYTAIRRAAATLAAEHGEKPNVAQFLRIAARKLIAQLVA